MCRNNDRLASLEIAFRTLLALGGLERAETTDDNRLTLGECLLDDTENAVNGLERSGEVEFLGNRNLLCQFIFCHD